VTIASASSPSQPSPACSDELLLVVNALHAPLAAVGPEVLRLCGRFLPTGSTPSKPCQDTLLALARGINGFEGRSGQTLIQQWNGSSWSIVPSPSPDPFQNLLTDIDGVSANDVWAIGNLGNDGYGGTTAGLVLHWDGASWSQMNVPGTVSDGTFNVPTLQDVIALSANDVWIGGRAFSWIDFKIVPIALHWNGQTWQRTVMSSVPNDGQGFQSIAALSATKVYAFGSMIARFTGTGWAAESAGVPGTLIDAAATGTSTVWAIGYRYDPNLATLRTFSMRTNNG
jgi:hypothetical protein